MPKLKKVMPLTLGFFGKLANGNNEHLHIGDERFPLGSTLGKGTYGKVKQISDSQAVKLVRNRRVLHWRTDQKLLRRECEFLAKLPDEYPGAKLHHLKNGDIALELPLYQMTLKTYLEQELNDNQRIALTRALISKIYLIHNKKIIHKDISLENIFVNIDNNGMPTAFIGDFGLACYEHQATKEPAGNYGYLDPDLLVSHPNNDEPLQSFPHDIFALGRVIALIWGAEPLETAFPEEYLDDDGCCTDEFLKCSRDYLDNNKDKLPEEIFSFLQKMCHPYYVQRYTAASALKDFSSMYLSQEENSRPSSQSSWTL